MRLTSQFQKRKEKVTKNSLQYLLKTGHPDLSKVINYFTNFSKIYVFNSSKSSSYIEIVIGSFKFSCRLSNHPPNKERLNWYKDTDCLAYSFKDVINYYKNQHGKSN